MQADSSPQKQANPPTLDFFSLTLLFSNHQDRDEGWLNLFFPSLLQLSGSLWFVSSEHPVFSHHHSLSGSLFS